MKILVVRDWKNRKYVVNLEAMTSFTLATLEDTKYASQLKDTSVLALGADKVRLNKDSTLVVAQVLSDYGGAEIDLSQKTNPRGE